MQEQRPIRIITVHQLRRQTRRIIYEVHDRKEHFLVIPIVRELERRLAAIIPLEDYERFFGPIRVPKPKEFLTVEEAAEYASRARTTIRKWIRRGQITAEKDLRGRWLISTPSLKKYLEGLEK